jgi:hypothetical protein
MLSVAPDIGMSARSSRCGAMIRPLTAMTWNEFMTVSNRGRDVQDLPAPAESPAGLVLSLCDRTGNMVRPWAEGAIRA